MTEDFGLSRFARPAGAIEHGHGHHQRMMLARAVMGRLELPVKAIDYLHTLARGLFVFVA
jgi:hypothetical protein